MNQRHKNRTPAAPSDWLVHAQSDLKLARLGIDEDVLPEQICFHAQQAVEKAFKAVLLARKVDFPFTHDIEELLSVFEQSGEEPPQELQEAGMLTPYAVESRYPGYWSQISEADVMGAVSLAEKATAWAAELIQRPDSGK
jgi:HEPN domain-containing protein